MKSVKHLMSLLVLIAPLFAIAAPSEKPAEPFTNPYLAASEIPITHGRGDFNALAGPSGPGRRLHADEIQWKTLGPVNAWAPIYSSPYPNGKRVIWVGGYDRVAKLDADTLDVLTTYAIGGNTYFGDEEIRRIIATTDRLDDADFVRANQKLWAVPLRSIWSVYRLLSRDGELYMPYRGADGTISLRVYGETDATDPASAIVLRREWRLPADITKAPLGGMTMTSDGRIVLVTADGTLIALARDLATHNVLKLPRRTTEVETQDPFGSFVRNNLTVDDHGGIYVVTLDNMHRVQWTGSRLSLDEADGGWSAPYPNAPGGKGSGTTPGLMGWGPKEDHLVMIADGSRSNNAVAFWRGKIPDDWKGLPGLDRRVAGITPIRFGVAPDEQVVTENAPIIYGYGAFFNSTYPTHSAPQDTPAKRWLTDSLSMHIPGHEARGGTVIRWDPRTRTLKQAWQTQTNFVSTVCSVSGATELVYCWGNRNREWTLEGTDWHTGKSAFVYTLGKSHRFNPLGGFINIAPNGAVDCACTGGLGMVRVRPKESSVSRK